MAVPVSLAPEALAPYPRFSLYNSPYPAHDRGCAIDLYPDADVAPSPVAGEVLDTRTTRAPPKPYAAEHDYLVLIDAGEYVARVLHVQPSVAAGDRVRVGDPLGRLVRSGYFAPWVDDHVHLGFREPDANHYRASGSLPVSPAVPVTGVPWDGAGTVVETGETYAVLDAPGHPAPGERYAAIAAADGTPLDGGLVHYGGGGALADDPGDGVERPVSLLGRRVGTARGRTVEWADVAVLANGERVTGLSLACGRDALGAKLVCPDHDLAVGDRVAVAVEPTDDPVRLG
ncbi:MAG: hypothetical protein ABEJ23_01940 [Haloarculaceae archaeon]